MSTKDTHKPSRNDLLNDLEDIKSSLEKEVFGDLLANATKKDPKQRELEAALEKEVFGTDAESEQDPTINPPPRVEDEDIPVLTEVTENIVDLTDITLDDEEELDAEALHELTDRDEQLEEDLAQVLAEEEKPQPVHEPDNQPDKQEAPPLPAAEPAKTKQASEETSAALKSASNNHIDDDHKPAREATTASALPGQQSLFDDQKPAAPARKPAKTPPKTKPKPAAATEQVDHEKKTENPFLPAHIRERLNRNHEQSVLQELAQVGDALAKTDASAALVGEISLTPAEAALIDSLVARYLPEIERELRKQLAEKLTKKPVTP